MDPLGCSFVGSDRQFVDTAFTIPEAEAIVVVGDT